MSTATATFEDGELVQLERQLHESRAHEQTSKAALRQLHQDLKDAHFTIAQQQLRLDNVTKKLRSNRDVGEAASGLDDLGSSPFRLVDLAHPDNFSRRLVHGIRPATYRSQPRRQPVPTGGMAARIEALWRTLPAWTKGGISIEDAGFLAGLIDELRPETMYEVGVASGASSALILSSMAAYAGPAKVWLQSYDIAKLCYFDSARAVGDATRTMVPHLLKHWELSTPATALDVPHAKPGAALYFIDANHDHP